MSKENQAKEESRAKMENLVSLVGMVYLVDLESTVFQEEMVKRVKKVTLVLLVKGYVSGVHQVLQEFQDNKALLEREAKKVIKETHASIV